MKHEMLNEALNEISNRHLTEVLTAKRNRPYWICAVAAVLAIVIFAFSLTHPFAVSVKAIGIASQPRNTTYPQDADYSTRKELLAIMSLVFSCLLLREKMTVRKAIAIIMSFSGILTVAGKDLVQFNPRILTGILLCICAAVSYGAFTALNKKYHYDTLVSMMVSFFAAFLLSLLTNLLMGTDFHITPLQIAGLAWNGIFVMALATTTWALALNLGDTAKISNLAYITPFLSLIWTNLFLQEPVDLWSVSGLVIIVLGIFIQLKDKHA